ncbi:MAG: helical backbone metal receptor [Bacteroidota bacterium]
MPLYTDQLNRQLLLPDTPKRIISLVPSQTELLFDLGLDTEVIGITKFCVHPDEWFRNKTRIGGTKTVKQEIITSLEPDLIIANKEENVKEQIEALEKMAPVWISDINTIDDAINMIRSIGTITGTTAASENIIHRIQKGFTELTEQIASFKKIRTAYLIWKDPYMVAAGDTFIHDVMSRTGFENVFVQQNRYPEITVEILKQKQTELLLLSSEPYPFQQKHIDELQALLPDTQILLVDGEIFSWYGSRLQYTPAYLQQLIALLKQ